jgi:hypothetical protein
LRRERRGNVQRLEEDGLLVIVDLFLDEGIKERRIEDL